MCTRCPKTGTSGRRRISLATHACVAENVGMMSAETLEHCFTDFVAGKSLAKIAEKRGVCKRTLERYSASQHWVIRRQRAWNLAKEKIVEEIAGRTKSNDRLLSGQLWRLLQETVAEHRAFMNGQIPKKAMRGGVKEMISLSKALYHCNFAERLNLVNGEAFLATEDGAKLSI